MGLHFLLLFLVAAAQAQSPAHRRGAEAPREGVVPPRQEPGGVPTPAAPASEGLPPVPGTTQRSAGPVWQLWWNRNRSAYEGPLPEAGLGAREREWRCQRRTELREQVAGEILRVLERADGSLRGAAAIALGRLGWEAATPAITSLLMEGRRDVRTEALLALGLLSHSPATYELLRLAAGKTTLPCREEPGLLQALAAVSGALAGGPPLLPWIRDAVEDRRGSAGVRATLVTALGLARDAGGAPLLRALAQDPSEVPLVRCAALTGLGRSADCPVPLLLELLDDRDGDPPVRAAAALALATVPGDAQCDVVRRLQRALEGESHASVRPFLLLALGHRGGSAAELTLVHALQEASEEERSCAALALGLATRAGAASTGFEALLQRGSASRNPGVRGAILAALGLSGQPRAVEVLTAVLREESDTTLRRTAAEALLLLPRGAGAATFQELTREENDPEVMLAAARGLARLGTAPASALVLALRTRRSAPSAVRVPLVLALGETQDPSVVPFLLELLHGETSGPAVQEAAVQSLGRIFDCRPGSLAAPLGHATHPFQEPPPITLILSLEEVAAAP